MLSTSVIPVVLVDSDPVNVEKCYLKERKKKGRFCLKPCSEGAARRGSFFARALEKLGPDVVIQLIQTMVQELQEALPPKKNKMRGSANPLKKLFQKYAISRVFNTEHVFLAEKGVERTVRNILDDGRTAFGYAYPGVLQHNLDSCAERPVLQAKLEFCPLGMEFTGLVSMATLLVEITSPVSFEQVYMCCSYSSDEYSTEEREVIFAYLLIFLLSWQKDRCANRSILLEFVNKVGLFS